MSDHAHENAIKAATAVLWRDGLGKLTHWESRIMAERVIKALGLSWPCNRCDRVSGDGICWFHNI